MGDGITPKEMKKLKQQYTLRYPKFLESGMVETQGDGGFHWPWDRELFLMLMQKLLGRSTCLLRHRGRRDVLSTFTRKHGPAWGRRNWVNDGTNCLKGSHKSLARIHVPRFFRDIEERLGLSIFNI